MARRDSAEGAALDPALTQKKRARRRLVGAMVLGIAAAIVLPLVLDSEPRQTITDVEIEIPPRDAPMPKLADGASATSPVARGDEIAVPPAEPVAEGEAATAQAKAAEAASAAEAKAAADAKARDAKAAAESKAAAEARAREAKAAEAKAAEATARESRTTAAKQPAPSAKSTQAASGKSAPAAPTSSDAAATRFALQVGAYANAGSARAQADKVRKAGVRAYTETVQTSQGSRTRVRVGPFDSREAAEGARAKLKLAGIDSAVVGH